MFPPFLCLLTGGLCCFRQSHENLCEHSLHLHEGLDTGAAAGLTGPLPHSLPSTPDIENAELTPILPFLYLGNEHDAQDINLLQRLNIGYILNVTTHLPLYHYDTGLFIYKRLPATDSNKQNLRQYFEEAFEFIGMKTWHFIRCWHCRSTKVKPKSLFLMCFLKDKICCFIRKQAKNTRKIK